MKRDAQDARFSLMIRERDGWTCQLWTGRISSNGYGRLYLNGRDYYAHRLAYEQVNGPIPEGLQIDHLCRNRACVNPAHLEAVTVRENTLRGVGYAAQRAAQTHCIHGHEFTPENTYHRPDRRRSRNCIACDRQRNRERKRREAGR